MINEKVINDKKMIEHIKPITAKYYEYKLLKNASVDEKSFNSYQSGIVRRYSQVFYLVKLGLQQRDTYNFQTYEKIRSELTHLYTNVLF